MNFKLPSLHRLMRSDAVRRTAGGPPGVVGGAVVGSASAGPGWSLSAPGPFDAGRRHWLGGGLAVVGLGWTGASWAEEAWPARQPIHFIVPFTPGGANDVVGRAIAEGVHQQLGQNVVVENRPGAGAIIGAEYVAHAKPDGYTFLVGAIGVVTNSLLRAKMPYADSDLTPVGLVALSPSIIVMNAAGPAEIVKAPPTERLRRFIDWSRTRPGGGANFATAGTGTTPHFVAEMLRGAGAQLTVVHYKSGSEGVTAVLGGQVDATSEASGVVMPHLRSGRLVALAVTGEARLATLPDVASTAEQGFPDVRIAHWAGIFAPRGTPAPIVDRMSEAIEAATRSKALQATFATQGIEAAGGSRARFEQFIADERGRLGRLIKATGMQID